jgi:putative tryptophan/tyrosine transport system substrate-binding protein
MTSVMDRRAFLAIATGAVATSLAAEAQQAGRVARIGVLCPIACDGAGVDAFRLALRDLGYVESRTLVFEFRAADGRVDRLPALATELVQTKVDVIFTTWGTAAALAAKRATATIPVVVGGAGDPVKAGIVPTLAKPGGNVTGVSSVALELESKRLELLKEVVPKVSRVGAFWDPENTYSALAIKQEEMAASALGVRLHPVRLRAASDLENAFEALKRDRVEALSVHAYVVTVQNRAAIIAFAAANRMAAIYPLREYVTEGGLVSYGANVAAISQRAAHYVDRILRGAKPADLPVEQPRNLELAINMKTAKALGLTIPPSLLLRANQVIE